MHKRSLCNNSWFRVYDTNGDGYIDFTEFMTIFYIMSEGSPEEVLAGIFRMFDYNSDGTITEDWSLTIFTWIYNYIHNLWRWCYVTSALSW